MFNAIVLSGGGIKGFGTLGGIQYLLDNNLLSDLKYYSGTSIGSIICYFLAIGYTPIEMIIYIISNKVFDIPDANIDSFKNYVDPRTGKKFDNAIEARKHAFSRGNEFANMLGCTRQSVLIVGDFLFIHAGIEAEFLQNYRGRNKLYELNALVRNWILNKLSHVSEEEEKVLNNSNYSPFWTRILGSLPPHLPYDDARCQEHLEPILNSYKIKGMIIGHTPQLDDGINSTCGNKLFRVDVAASKAFHDSDEGVTQKREPQILEIKKLPNNTYKYNVIFQKRDSYDVIVSDDNRSFGKLESRLPN
jgi:hypothetical protein